MTPEPNLIPNLPTRDQLRTLNSAELLSLARKLKKAESKLPAKKIALVGTCNLHFMAEALRPYLMTEGFSPVFFEGGVRSYPESLINPQSELIRFQPDVVISVTTWRDVRDYPALLDSSEAVADLVNRYLDKQYSYWNEFHRSSSALVLQSNLVLPPRHLLGQLEANVPYGRDALLRKINALGAERRPDYLFYTDFDSIAADFGKERWFDEPGWFLSKLPFAMDALPAVAAALSDQIAAVFGVTRKCLVVDLDNTLWGGIIGDDGVEGINLDPNHALGEAFIAFQQSLKAYRERGVLLAVCSKNEDKNARAPFAEHPNMVLKLEDFAAFIANWQPKAENLLTIAHQLNITTDALVFFDDNPAEREAVRRSLPMVTVVEVPEDPALFSQTLFKGNYFEPAQLSREDLGRTESLRSDSQRAQLQSDTSDYGAYLAALAMKADFGPLKSAEIPRFTQLLNKTNQFNFRTQRYSESEIAELSANPDTRLYRVLLEDRFSHYGLIAALIVHLKPDQKSAFIDSWVMSCRVFQRELEIETMNQLAAVLKAEEIEFLDAEYIPSPKNAFVADLLPRLGFRTVKQADNVTSYEISLAEYKRKCTKISID